MRRLPVALSLPLCAAALAGCGAAPDARAAESAVVKAFAGDGGPGDAAPRAAAARGWSAPRAATALTGAPGVRSEAAAVAVDGAGVLHALFALDRDRDGRGDALEYARLQGGAWSAPQPVASTLSLADPATLAVDGGGTVHVLWYAHTGVDSDRGTPTELMERHLAGGRWSEPRVLYHEPSRFGMGVRWLAAAMDPRGDVQVLFAPQGRGFGSLALRGERAGAPRYLDHDGNMMAFSASAGGAAPLEVAYIGERVSKARPRAVNDVFVRSLSGAGAWGESTEAYYGPARYSHYPQLVVDGRGGQRLFWLEDTDGTVQPEALFTAASAQGARWSAPRDITPPELRGWVPLRVHAVVDAAGRAHLLVRYATPGVPRVALAYLSVDEDGTVSPARTLAGPGEMGGGEARLAYDAPQHRVIALWQAPDGVYRWAERAAD